MLRYLTGLILSYGFCLSITFKNVYWLCYYYSVVNGTVLVKHKHKGIPYIYKQYTHFRINESNVCVYVYVHCWEWY